MSGARTATRDFIVENQDWIKATLPSFGYGSNNWHHSFPMGEELMPPEMQDFRDYCNAAMHDQRHTDAPQKPNGLVVGCSRIPLVDIFGGQPGELAVVSGRAGQISPEGVASLKYFLGLGTPVVFVTVHSCTAEGVCRNEKFAEPDNRWGKRVTLPQISETPSVSGLEVKDFNFNHAAVPEKDRLHARKRALKVILNSPEIREKIATGKLLFLESYFEEKTGKVHWLSCWRSSDPHYHVDKLGNLEKAISNPSLDPNHLHEISPSVQAWIKSIQANKHFADGYDPALTRHTEFVVNFCSDARVGKAVKAPYGLIETHAKAGNSPDDGMFHGILDSFRRMERHFSTEKHRPQDPIGRKRRPGYITITHTKCGMGGAAVDAKQHGVSGEHAKHPDLHELAMPLIDRLGVYFEDHKEPEKSDPKLAHLAVVNAFTANLRILTSPDPDAVEIRKMVLDDSAFLGHGVFSIKRGRTNLYPPFTRDFVIKLQKDFPLWFS
jgi:carbonic anhydrase